MSGADVDPFADHDTALFDQATASHDGDLFVAALHADYAATWTAEPSDQIPPVWDEAASARLAEMMPDPGVGVDAVLLGGSAQSPTRWPPNCGEKACPGSCVRSTRAAGYWGGVSFWISSSRGWRTPLRPTLRARSAKAWHREQRHRTELARGGAGRRGGARLGPRARPRPSSWRWCGPGWRSRCGSRSPAM